jgi:hypothetical protein
MEKQNQKVDEFFREALQHHVVVPSDAAKAAFLKEAATLTKTGKPGRKIFICLSGIIILLLICAGIYIGRQGFSVKKIQNMNPHSSSIVKTNSPITDQKSNVHETYLPLIASNTNSKDHPSYLFSNHSLHNHAIPDRTSAEQNNPEKSFSSTESSPSQLPSIILEKDKSGNTIPPIRENPIALQPLAQISPNQNPAAVIPADSSVVPTANAEILSKHDQDQHAKKNGKNIVSGNSRNCNIDLGAYYSPEWMFNTLEGEKYANNFGIEGTFHFGNYSIRTGAGLSITNGTHELSISYNDYLGNFNHLDSISFTWDPSHTHIIPTYHFTQTNVWDSLMKTQHAKIIRRYTYLQVPFILGYDFWKNDRFSIGLRVGPILSVLLKTEQISDNYNPGKDRIIQINLITPERIQTYWQFMGGINASSKLSKRFGIELEPDVRYYFNSVYEQPANYKKPWSLGFRVAFLIKN